MLKNTLSKESRALRRAWVPWALLAFPGLTAGCGDDGGGGGVVVELDAGTDAAAVETTTNEPDDTTTGSEQSSQTLVVQTSGASTGEVEPTTGGDDTTEVEPTTDGPEPTSEPEPTTGGSQSTSESESTTSDPQPTSESASSTGPSPEPSTTSESSTGLSASTDDGPAVTNDTSSASSGVFTGWSDGGVVDTSETATDIDAGYDLTTDYTPYEFICGRPIGMPEADAGEAAPGEWPLDEPDSGAFDAGLLINGSFDVDTAGWSSAVNMNGVDTDAEFFWGDGRVSTGLPYMPNAQAFYQDFTVPVGAVTSAVFSFDVTVFNYYQPYQACFQDLATLEPMYLVPHDAFRVDIVAPDGDVFGDAGMATVAADAGATSMVGASTLLGDAGATSMVGTSALPGDAGAATPQDDAGVLGELGVFTSPILFTLFAPETATYGVQHIVVDGDALATFLDGHQGQTLRLRFGVVSSSFAVLGQFDNVSLSLGN